MVIKLDVSMSQRLARSLSRQNHRILIRSLCVSGKLATYPSLKPTFCLKWEVSVNVGLGEGWKGGKFPRNVWWWKLGHTNCFAEAEGLLTSGHYVACVASVSVRFRSKERGTRVKGRAKNGVSERALVSFLARPKPRIPFLGLSLLRNQTETLATQASHYVNVALVARVSSVFVPYPTLPLVIVW